MERQSNLVRNRPVQEWIPEILRSGAFDTGSERRFGFCPTMVPAGGGYPSTPSTGRDLASSSTTAYGLGRRVNQPSAHIPNRSPPAPRRSAGKSLRVAIPSIIAPSCLDATKRRSALSTTARSDLPPVRALARASSSVSKATLVTGIGPSSVMQANTTRTRHTNMARYWLVKLVEGLAALNETDSE